MSIIQDKELRYRIIAYYQYIDFVKVLDAEHNESLNRMKENLFDKIVYHNEDELIIQENQVDIILIYLEQKRSFIAGYLGHRKNCNQLNSAIVKKIQEEFESL